MKDTGYKITKWVKIIKRSWTMLTCEHLNSCVSVVVGVIDITICQSCGRVLYVMDDNDRTHNMHKKKRLNL